MTRHPTWVESRKHHLTPEFCADFAARIRDGYTIKKAALSFEIPPGVVRYWLREGEAQRTRALENGLDPEAVGFEAKLWDAVAPALADRDMAQLRKVDDAKWKLERYDSEDFGPAAARVEVSGPEGGPIELEDRTVTRIAQVVQLLRDTGQDHFLGLDSEPPRQALPPAPDVLSDPPEGEPAAGRLPAA